MFQYTIVVLKIHEITCLTRNRRIQCRMGNSKKKFGAVFHINQAVFRRVNKSIINRFHETPKREINLKLRMTGNFL